jgi:cytochrome c oxidase assembly protein subunit 15
MRRFAAGLALLTFLMILSGGLVAGLHAGLLYNTFPLMGGRVVPPLALAGRPLLRDLVSNPATVQFNHRVIGWTLALAATAFCLWVSRAGAPRRVRLAARALLAGVALQFVLGVATLLLLVPLPLAVAHQAGAMVVFGLAMWVNEELR